MVDPLSDEEIADRISERDDCTCKIERLSVDEIMARYSDHISPKGIEELMAHKKTRR